MVKKAVKKKAVKKAVPKKKAKVHKPDATSANNSERSKSAAKRGSKKVMRKSGRKPVVHCMLAPTGESSLLLPTSVLAEVLDYQPPAPIDLAPPWLIGQIEWEDRQVPVFSFGALINGSEVEEALPGSKIMILKSLSDSGRVPYLAILLTDLPRMIKVEEYDLEQTGDDKKSLGVFSRIRLEEQDAIVPDLDRLTHLVTHATFGALPITQLDD